jgi:hypothetical protein
MKHILLSFVGPSGSGKTTAAKFAVEMLREKGICTARLDVAEPLREIQSFAYARFGRPSPGDASKPETFLQDGKLLGFLAGHFENFLQDSFCRRFNKLMKDFSGPFTWTHVKKKSRNAVINADCRNNSYEYLKELGFIFIRLQISEETRAKRLTRRSDLSKGVTSIDATDQISESIFINNDDLLSELKDKIGGVITGILTNDNIKGDQ